MSTCPSKSGSHGSKSRQKTGCMPLFVYLTPKSGSHGSKVDKKRMYALFVYLTPKIRLARIKSRQKPGCMPLFCLPDPQNQARTDPEVDKNGMNASFCLPDPQKSGPCGSESRTKSPKFGKMFYRKGKTQTALEKSFNIPANAAKS